MSVINNNLLLTAAAGGATAGRSVRFNSADSAYLSRTPASAGNRRTWTLSMWVKRCQATTGAALFFGGPTDSTYTRILFTPENIQLQSSDSGTLAINLTTSAVFRDFSSWYHFVFSVDTTQGTASNRVKLYVNGSQITTFSTSTYPSQNYDTHINRTEKHSIGAEDSSAIYYKLNAYLADIHLIDGQALTPSSFGESSATTGQWIAKTYSGTYGTNGFFLDFADNSTAAALGYDAAGSNDWTVNNLSVTAGSGNDSLRDHPTSAGTSTGLGGEVSGNYCTWNPLNSSTYTFANGNLEATGYAGNSQMVSTIGVSSGKWYCEISLSGSGGTSNAGIGISKGEQGTYPGELSTSYGYFGSASKINAGSVTSYGATYTYGDIIGIALDMDAGTCTMYKNGSSQGQLASGLSGTYFIAVRNSSNAGDKTIANFGQRPWAYTCPSGFSPLVDTLLPTPTIAKPNTVMDVALYTGNGTSQSITLPGGFSPDFVWLKSRADGADVHHLFDTIRGAGVRIFSNLTNAESTDNQTLTSFNSDGFSVGSHTAVNQNGEAMVGWTWDAGSSNATNTSGTITSTVRANISAGFSVVTYNAGSLAPATGATVGHGLGVAPQFIIVKDRTNANPWAVYHTSLGPGKGLLLSSTAAEQVASTWWNNTAPSSTVFSINSDIYSTAQPNDNYVAYCWTPVAGLSSFGSYVGNGSSDGPFVYTGFRPRWVMVKKTNSASISDWVIQDAGRDTYNPSIYRLYSNLSNAEDNGSSIDFLSNGFKIRVPSAYANINETSSTYIYACFAESPLPYARAR